MRWNGSIRSTIAALLVIAFAAPAGADPAQASSSPSSPACLDNGDGTITCRLSTLEAIRNAHVDLELKAAKSSAELARCEGNAADAATVYGIGCAARIKAAVNHALASRPPPSSRTVSLASYGIGLTAAAGGGVCLASANCPKAAGWASIGAAIVAGAVAVLAR